MESAQQQNKEKYWFCHYPFVFPFRIWICSSLILFCYFFWIGAHWVCNCIGHSNKTFYFEEKKTIKINEKINRNVKLLTKWMLTKTNFKVALFWSPLTLQDHSRASIWRCFFLFYMSVQQFKTKKKWTVFQECRCNKVNTNLINFSIHEIHIHFLFTILY